MRSWGPFAQIEAKYMRQLSKWPEERLQHLALLWADPGKTLADIARELKTNREAVKRQAKALRLRGRLTSISRWSAARAELLRDCATWLRVPQ
jgi:DNA-binding MarR family transcriptional regulator